MEVILLFAFTERAEFFPPPMVQMNGKGLIVLLCRQTPGQRGLGQRVRKAESVEFTLR